MTPSSPSLATGFRRTLTTAPLLVEHPRTQGLRPTMATTTTHTIELDPTVYDKEQIQLMEERLILLDQDDHAIGEGSKKDCHLIPPRGASEVRSPLHRAFSVFLFHPTTGKLLLQRRAAEKITFPNMWTNTCCSHPLTSNGEMEEPAQIGVRKAASRKLVHELGIPITYELDEFAYLTRIHYYAPSDEIWAEHESTLRSLHFRTGFSFSITDPSRCSLAATVDYILFLALDATVEANPNEVSDTKWVSKADLQDLFKDPESTFTPWFKLIAESFLYKWWDALLESRKSLSDQLDARNLIPLVAQQQEEMGNIIRM
ncbi:BQ5605_C024g09785 [Microbotryum silenes-dioicae]|uniref:isopentenyl-diphosphate Delta-isomerase n=1 Tax=Microbotryum silenes-dioicae TaxID=796604 RepID=A0A2X0MLN4_9BASI|nr:BQ5605_C024g09785 [Microbotryum silenes-dioicae]